MVAAVSALAVASGAPACVSSQTRHQEVIVVEDAAPLDLRMRVARDMASAASLESTRAAVRQRVEGCTKAEVEPLYVQAQVIKARTGTSVLVLVGVIETSGRAAAIVTAARRHLEERMRARLAAPGPGSRETD